MNGVTPLPLITVFGLGHRRPFPGTWGSLPPPILAGLLIASGLGPGTSPWIYHAAILLLLAFFSFACVRQGDQAEAAFGKKDPSQCVADEVAGQCIPLLLLPPLAVVDGASAAFTLIFAFVAFRVFDILKIWPARSLQAIPAGWGILIDDLIAGVQAWVTLQAAYAFA